MKRRALVVVIGVAAVAGASLAVWRGRAPRHLSQGRGTDAEIEPHLAARDKQIVAVWMGVSELLAEGADRSQAPKREVEAAKEIGLRRSRDQGATWDDIVGFSPGAGRFVADPTVAIDPDGRVFATWLAFRWRPNTGGMPFDMGIQGVMMAPGEANPTVIAYTAPSRLRRYDRPWTTWSPSGGFRTVFRFEEGSNAGISFLRSLPNHPHTTTTVVEGPGFAGGLATVCAGESGRAWVAYIDPTEGVVLRATFDDGATFPPESKRILSKPGETVANEAPACAVADNTIWVVYGVSTAPNNTAESAQLGAVHIEMSSDLGRSFPRRESIVESGSEIMHPQIALQPRATLHIGYTVKSSASGDGAFVVRTLPADAPMTDARRIRPVRFVARRAERGWSGDYMGMAWSPAGLYAAIVDNRDTEPHVDVERIP